MWRNVVGHVKKKSIQFQIFQPWLLGTNASLMHPPLELESPFICSAIWHHSATSALHWWEPQRAFTEWKTEMCRTGARSVSVLCDYVLQFRTQQHVHIFSVTFQHCVKTLLKCLKKLTRDLCWPIWKTVCYSCSVCNNSRIRSIKWCVWRGGGSCLFPHIRTQIT